jgi:serine/threonine-protein kinase HipA
MPSHRERVSVHVADPRWRSDQPVGYLTYDRSRPPGTFSFAYTSQWIESRAAIAIDPRLPLVPSEIHFQALPGAFADASPDRWGRILLDRREQIEARARGRQPRTLNDWDYLLGVQDETRMGGLRLAGETGVFLADQRLGVPPLADVRRIQQLADSFERGRPLPTADAEAWLATLVIPGSSLGGARPKATVRDVDGSLWIAKFPSHNDRHDVGAWEYVLNRLAASAGIAVPESRLLSLASHHTFSARRFDRDGQARRLYASAMTLTGKTDRASASYLDVAAALEQYGNPATLPDDLHQVFRRLVFNVSSAHRDDHLRNHGFVHDGVGWRPAPAFDLNPTPEQELHALALDDTSTVPSLATVRSTASLYRLSAAEATAVIEEVADALRSWRDVAARCGLNRQEMDQMAPAFELPK